jgi:hypothetical protein
MPTINTRFLSVAVRHACLTEARRVSRAFRAISPKTKLL